MPGRALPAAHPHTEFTTSITTPLPAGATEIYRGTAENSDFLLKYVTVQPYDG